MSQSCFLGVCFQKKNMIFTPTPPPGKLIQFDSYFFDKLGGSKPPQPSRGLILQPPAFVSGASFHLYQRHEIHSGQCFLDGTGGPKLLQKNFGKISENFGKKEVFFLVEVVLFGLNQKRFLHPKKRRGVNFCFFCFVFQV